MSYVFDPTTGLVQRVSNMSISPHPHDPSRGIYCGTYGSNEEHEVLRHQSPEPRDPSRYMYGPHSPAGTRSHRVSGFETSNSSRHFPARATSISGSSELWDSQRDINTPGRHNGLLDSTGGHCDPGRGNSIPHRYHDGLRSKEDLVEELVAKVGITGYTYLIDARDNILLREEPMRSDEELLAEKLADLDRKAYLQRTTSGDGLRPLCMSEWPTAGLAHLPEEAGSSYDYSSREVIRSLNEYYRRELKQDLGHRFDNVDNTVIAAYINACAYASRPRRGIHRIIGRDQPFSFFSSWVVPIPFLNLALEVMLPVDQEAITELNNDVLRVLYVHLSNDSRTIFSGVTIISIEESRRLILSELMRRGFTGELPHVVRLRGLNHYSVPRSLRDPSWLSNSAPGSSASVDQISREVKTSSHGSKDRRDNKARQNTRRGSTTTTENFFGEVSEKKKGKAPVARVYEDDSADHSSAASSSNRVQHELEVSSSEDSTPPTNGKAPAIEATSHRKSYDSSGKTTHRADKIPSGHKSSVPKQQSDNLREE